MAKLLELPAEITSGHCATCNAPWAGFLECDKPCCNFVKTASPATGWQSGLPAAVPVPEVTVAVSQSGWKSEIVVTDSAWRSK